MFHSTKYGNASILTDVGRPWRHGSHRAKTSGQLVLVFLGKPVERASVEVVPVGFHSDLVVIWYVMYLVEHDRHARLLSPQRHLRRRTCVIHDEI